MLAPDTEIRKDHETIRNKVGFYDFTHEMLRVTGDQREEFLDKMFTNSMGDMEPGGAQYTQMLNEDGIILDDVIVFRIDDSEFWVSTLDVNSMIEWFDKNSSDFNVEYKDFTDQNVMYAVQGPKSREVLNKFLDQDISNQAWFSISENKIDGNPIHIARAGFTGELGFELYADPKHKDLIESKLLEAGEPHDIREINSDAKLTSIPVEKGYVLMTDVEGTTPLEAGFSWAVDWDTDFIGKSALQKAKDEGVSRKLRGFVLEDDAEDIEIEAGASVELNGENVGEVRNFTYGYTVDKYIGYALVDSNKTNIGDKISVDGYDAELTKRSFYDTDDERVRQS